MKTFTLPGSKSITNRDLILASLFEGKTTLKGGLFSDDTQFMMHALRDLGIEVDVSGNTITVYGGVNQIEKQETEIYVGQSGIAIKFLPALCCLLTEGKITFSGEERLMQRPLGPLIDAIKQLGIRIDSREDNFPPLTIFGGKITNNTIKMDGTISSQYFSALLNIAPFIEGGLQIEVLGDLVSKPYIDMTLHELSKFGVEVENENYEKFKVGYAGMHTKQEHEKNITIEGDASALSYIANYIVLHGGRLEIMNLGSSSKQGDYRYLEILKKYFGLEYESNGETTLLKAGGLQRVGNEKNHSLQEDINFESMPDVSMSFMSLAIFLKGETKITGLQTLNLKECKRIDAMKSGLTRLGVEVSATEDSITIGEYKHRSKQGGIAGFFGSNTSKIDTYNDHRIAMSFGVLETYLAEYFDEKIEILNPGCVAKTYPNFWEDLKRLGEIEDRLRVSE